MGQPPNPYVGASGPPRTRRSVTAFLDILGFGEQSRQSYKNSIANDLLQRLRAALDRALEAFRLKWPGRPSTGRAFWHVKAFTDKIVIGCPVALKDDDAEGELGSVLI